MNSNDILNDILNAILNAEAMRAGPKGVKPAPTGVKPAPTGVKPAPTGVKPAPKGVKPAPTPAPTGPIWIGVDPAHGADALGYILAQRGSRYGKFKDQAKITQTLKDVMRACPKWSALTPSQKEALDMMAHKVGRILNGDPNYDDSWIDAAGYAKLVADELQGVSR